MTITREDVRRQIDLENEARDLGAVRYRQQRPLPWRTSEDIPTVTEEAELPPGRQLIKLAVEPTATLLRERLANADSGKAGRRHSALGWLALADLEAVAYLAARVAINAAIGRKLFQGVARQVGQHIVDHVRMASFSESNAGGYRGLLKSGKSRVSKNRRAAIRRLLDDEVGASPIPDAEVTRLGIYALETLVEATGLFVVERGVSRTGSEGYILRPSESVEDWLNKQHARCELLDPMMMPMIVRPKKWRSQYVGGYLTRMLGAKLIKVPPSAATYLGDLNSRDLSKVYSAVNHIQETPWRINKRLFSVMREVWDSGGVVGGLPTRDDEPLPAKPEDINENEESLKVWKREAAQVYERNASETSKRLALHQRIWIAERFVEEPAIWFPHHMDFRGRVYPMPATGVHPQADDTGKALLEFAHGLPLGVRGGWWLAVHVANLFGVDKVSFGDRVQWTYDHAAQLIDSALAPLDGDRFWTTADSPWMALAAIFDFADFLDKGETHVSHLPIPLDGSNSGLQHFSALLRDPVGAAAVNLVPADKPQDVYLEVATKAQTIVDTDDDPDAAPWRGGKVTRAISKKPTMTYVYSSTRFGMHEMVLQTLREIDAENAQRGLGPHLGGADNYAAARYLSHVLFDAMESVVRAASGAMAWLRGAAKLAAEGDLTVQWTAPDGLPILQAYREVLGQRHEVHWMGRRLVITLAVTGSKLNGRGQANGIAPNFVHSLDAAHLRAVARSAKAGGIDYLAVIHDSFGTHAARTDELVDILRDTFVEQYRPDVLGEFREELLGQLTPALAERLQPLPPKGNLDLNDVGRSAYLFA